MSEKSAIWKSFIETLGDLLRHIRKRCNDRVMRLLDERLRDKEKEVASIIIELEESRNKKDELERQIINTRDKRKSRQLRKFKADADRDFHAIEERRFTLEREVNGIRKQRELISAIPCAS